MPINSTLQIADDIYLPRVGFGTYLIPNEDVHESVTTAIGAGYRHIDTAEKYDNEQGVGAAIHHAIQNMGITRTEIFITTKVWPGYSQWGETSKTYASTIEALNASLERLKQDYVDLYLIHSPLESEQRIEQWSALVELQKQGKTRTIGVSNFNQSHIEELVDAGLPTPAVNQVELHPWSQKPQLIEYLKQLNITPMAYSSLAPLSSWRSEKDQASGKTDELKAEADQDSSIFKIMATNYNVSESQLLLRWAIQKGFAIIPKSVKAHRIALNFDLFDFNINEDDMAKLASENRDSDLAWGENFFEF